MAEGEGRESSEFGDSLGLVLEPPTTAGLDATGAKIQDPSGIEEGYPNAAPPESGNSIQPTTEHRFTNGDTNKQCETIAAQSVSADEAADLEEKKIDNDNMDGGDLANGYHEKKACEDSPTNAATDNAIHCRSISSAGGQQQAPFDSHTEGLLSESLVVEATTANGVNGSSSLAQEAESRVPLDPSGLLQRSKSRKPTLEEMAELDKQVPPELDTDSHYNENKQQDAPETEQNDLEHDTTASSPLPDLPLATDVSEPLGTINEAPHVDSPDGAERHDTQLSLEVWSKKDKEGFALLAMGDSLQSDSFRTTEPDVMVTSARSPADSQSDGTMEPSQPMAKHRLEPQALSPPDSQGQSRVSYAPTPPGDRVSEYDIDNSYRPSYSYPASPQGSQNAVQTNQYLAPGQSFVMITQQPPAPGPPHAFMAPTHPPLHHQGSFGSQHSMMGRTSYAYPSMPAPPAVIVSAKRKIRLRLQEEILDRPTHARRASFFFGGRSTRKLTKSDGVIDMDLEKFNEVDRGTITVSWFDGTSSAELQEHVYKSVARKLRLGPDKKLDDIRILDTASDPPEETVLCPYIPSGSEFVLRYKIKPAGGLSTPPEDYEPPVSPSAAPSPFSSHANLSTLNDSQLSLIRKQLDAIQAGESRKTPRNERFKTPRAQTAPPKVKSSAAEARGDAKSKSPEKTDSEGNNKQDEPEDSEAESETNTLPPENSVDAKLRQITELLLLDRQQKMHPRYEPRKEKRQVIFVLANYFVLFVALITISAEIQARLPNWIASIEKQLENVHQCSADQESLFECVTKGEFAGLFASVILWLSRSATTKQFFLFGFDTPKKLWSVFYESLVSAVCWGISYMLIRRGLNPDTRPNFLRKYWKDAVYGSLAGFNANFMKQVLKNLLPKESIEEAFNDRQLKILSWLPSFA